MIIQADKLPRILVCEGSLVMDGEQSPSAASDNNSESKREGMAAHELASAVLFGIIPNAQTWLNKQLTSGVYVTAEMVDMVTRYVDLLTTRLNISGPTLYRGIECNTDWQVSGDVRVNGRADYMAYDGTTLYVDDLKYGYRLKEPDLNWTLISHAIAYVLRERVLPQKIVFTIHQPRAYHFLGPVRTWEISGDQLAEFHAQVVAFFETRGTSLTTSEHCTDCPAFTTCPAARSADMNAIDVSKNKAFTDTLPNEALSVYLDDINRAIEQLEISKHAFTELAMHRLQNGGIIPEYSTELGQGNRVFRAGVSPELLSAFTMGRVPASAFAVVKNCTPAAAERAGVPKEIVAQIAARPSTGLKLVRRDLSKLAAKTFQ